ncbi:MULTISPECIES: T9SS type A sorting domain-containing protein [unclassified Lentimicrobium]|uniref:T9SS type A sorting domain-containing protein n=1 Tax=unclassified Lentimicrobium TaxID=2677434 RepID=UPI001557BAB8|nr:MULTISPECIES: T9SS type A sorting domain-containing protein [unclassified Lentimicrobium]NPD44488.1 T9SS type A sorting domain-containing protein [Lentimicrobium sp. S6]NPD84212.1 T9SS type A sorting domain-containing protein [Lentimicrobium sp. L6]
MKNYLLPFIAIIVLIAIVFIFENKNPRDTYANSINKELMAFQKSLPEESTDEKALGQPDMAALQEYYQVMDPVEKRVPQERLVKANKETKAILEASSFKNSQELEWENINSNMGGRTRALMWDPNSNTGNRVWAGSVTGGIWYNEDITDYNSEWHPVDDFMASLSISCLTYDPNETQTFYAGTGEAQTAIITYRESSGRGVGIWKSEDGGSTWSIIESSQNFAYITDIEVRDEEGISVIYAGVASGQYMGADHVSLPSDGLYRSDNGGDSWEQVLPYISNEIPYTPADIEIGPDGRIYIGTMRNIDGEGGAVILYSDLGTSGSWVENDDYQEIIEDGIGEYSLPGRVMLGTSASDNSEVYAIIGAGYENGFGYYHGNFVLKSYNSGEDWEELNIPNNDPTWASLSWHAFSIAVDPVEVNHFYIGGLDQYHSLNEGSTYFHVSDWAAMYSGGGDYYIHADQHVIKFKPGSSDEVIFGTDGGVFYTNNASASNPVFQERNNHYSSLQFYTCDIHPSTGEDQYLGGLQDNGTLKYTGNDLTIFDMIVGGDGAYCFYDKNEPNISLASYYYNRYTVFNGDNQVAWVGNNSTGTFLCPADLDSENNILFANGVGFFGQDANKMFRVKNLPNNPTEQLIDAGTNINTWFTAVTNSPYAELGSSTIFMGSNAGHLFKISNAQAIANTTEIGSSDFPTGAISCIAIGGSEDTLLVTFSNYGVSSVWQTYNGGNNWQEIEGNLPDMPIRWALYHPNSSKQALLATELGVWQASDLSANNPSWSPAIQGMANVRVDMLRIRESDKKVIAASHGRGLYTCTYDLLSVGQNELENTESFTVYPNPSNGKINIVLPDNESTIKQLQLFNMKGDLVFESSTSLKNNFVDLSNYSTGSYVLKLKTSSKYYSSKISIQ